MQEMVCNAANTEMRACHWELTNLDPNYLNIFWLNFSLGAIFLLFGLF
jgi:hypothetical protein